MSPREHVDHAQDVEDDHAPVAVGVLLVVAVGLLELGPALVLGLAPRLVLDEGVVGLCVESTGESRDRAGAASRAWRRGATI